MREIKFRAWDKKDKLWVAGWSIGQAGVQTETSNKVFMQYTGLQDKNGKEIYEGDIYEVGDLLYRVKFINGAFCGGILYYNDNDFSPLGFKCDRSEEDIILDNDTTFINVIGNLYENPELLDK